MDDDGDALDIGEAFERLEAGRVAAADPDSLAYFHAQKKMVRALASPRLCALLPSCAFFCRAVGLLVVAGCYRPFSEAPDRTQVIVTRVIVRLFALQCSDDPPSKSASLLMRIDQPVAPPHSGFLLRERGASG